MNSALMMSEHPGDQRWAFHVAQTPLAELRHFGPEFVRYEIDALVDGNPMVFSDDPSVGTPALEGSGSALVLYVQGIDIDITTGEPDPDRDPYNWRKYVGDFGLSQGEPGLNSDATLGFKFLLLRDSSVSTDVVVQELRVIYQS